MLFSRSGESLVGVWGRGHHGAAIYNCIRVVRRGMDFLHEFLCASLFADIIFWNLRVVG